jgi:A/G-specific adenine glycosylase
MSSAGASKQKQVVVAIAIVFDRERKRVLICRRPHDTVLPNYWEFPGGKADPGEALADCAVREVREELGVVVEAAKQLETIEFEYPHAHVKLHPFVCRYVSGEVQLLGAQDAKWLLPEEITGYKFPEANVPLLERVSRGWDALVG